MKRLIAGVASAAVVLGGLVGLAPTVSAATSWDYASGGSFTLSDGQGSTATVTISNVRVTGGSMSGRVGLANGRYTCSTQAFSDLTAQFSLGGQYDPCSGTVTFSVDSAGVLSVSNSSVYIPSTLLTGPGTGSAQGTEWKLTCSAVPNGSAGADVTWTDSVTGATGYTVTASAGRRPGKRVERDYERDGDGPQAGHRLHLHGHGERERRRPASVHDGEADLDAARSPTGRRDSGHRSLGWPHDRELLPS